MPVRTTFTPDCIEKLESNVAADNVHLPEQLAEVADRRLENARQERKQRLMRVHLARLSGIYPTRASDPADVLGEPLAFLVFCLSLACQLIISLALFQPSTKTLYGHVQIIFIIALSFIFSVQVLGTVAQWRANQNSRMLANDRKAYARYLIRQERMDT